MGLPVRPYAICSAPMFKMNQPDEAVSCTRAGILIVILSGLGLSLLQPLEMHLTQRDLSKYVVSRGVFAAQLDDLEHNPCLKHIQIHSMSLSSLSQSDCLKNRTPASNSALVAIEYLTILSDHNFLDRVRKGSFQFEVSIYSWTLRKNTFLEGLSNYSMMTFGNAKELSAFEFPENSKFMVLVTDHQVVQTPWTPLRVRLTNAATFVEFGMLLAVTYFWVFLQEATNTGSSHKQGTLFTAVSRTQFSRIVFILFLIIPPTIVGLLLRVSYRINNETEFVASSNTVLDAILFVGVLIMSALISRTAYIDWKRITSHAN